jgi:hypothetical protein
MGWGVTCSAYMEEKTNADLGIDGELFDQIQA